MEKKVIEDNEDYKITHVSVKPEDGYVSKDEVQTINTMKTVNEYHKGVQSNTTLSFEDPYLAKKAYRIVSIFLILVGIFFIISQVYIMGIIFIIFSVIFLVKSQKQMDEMIATGKYKEHTKEELKEMKDKFINASKENIKSDFNKEVIKKSLIKPLAILAPFVFIFVLFIGKLLDNIKLGILLGIFSLVIMFAFVLIMYLIAGRNEEKR